MVFSQALYYPWIDIRDEAWLKTSLLYWESIRTIVPQSIEEPYSTETGRQLYDAGFLLPVRVQSGMKEIEELADDVISFLQTNEGAQFLVAGPEQGTSWIHVEKLPYEFRQLARIHPEKLPWAIRQQFERLVRSRRRDEWLEVDTRFADYYMTLLATRLSERIGAGLLTPFANADHLALSVRTDARLAAVVPTVLSGSHRYWREYEAMTPRRNMPRILAQGLLAQLALERVSVDPDTPVDKILDFRDKHKDELAQFRTKIEQLTATISTDLPAEALHQQVMDIYNNEVEPALTNLKKALHARRIQWLSEGLLKIAFLSVSSSSMLVQIGLSVPMALLAGSGVSLVVSGILYNVDRAESLRSNPYSYLLAMHRELGR